MISRLAGSDGHGSRLAGYSEVPVVNLATTGRVSGRKPKHVRVASPGATGGLLIVSSYGIYGFSCLLQGGVELQRLLVGSARFRHLAEFLQQHCEL
jgi:hypothetical protein